MNPLLLFFASGESLYPGAALLLGLILISLRLRSRSVYLIRNALVWIGLLLIVMACPPFAWPIDVIFLMAFFGWYIVQNSHARSGTLRNALRIVLALSLIVLPVVECRNRAMPKISGDSSNHLAVIGDSISAGLGAAETSWPSVFQQLTGAPVKNLSRVGATSEDAVVMIAKLLPEDKLVLIEIGGNDLIANRSSEEFGQALGRLLSLSASPGRTLVMFELPLIPNQIEYGRIQRRLARQYGVWLIPKRFLVQVIRGADATTDGLHLTDVGARRMANLVASVLSPVLKPSLLSRLFHFPLTSPS